MSHYAMCVFISVSVVCLSSCAGKVTSTQPPACLNKMVSVITFVSLFLGILLPSTDGFSTYMGRWAGGGVESVFTGTPLDGFIFKLPLNSC